MAKLYTLKEATGGLCHDSVRYRKTKNKGKRYPELLRRCNQAWENLRKVREVRERTNNYTFGDQWGDLIHYQGGLITEREYIKKKGNIPLSNNIMISIFNSLTGLYAKQGTEPVCFARTRDAQKLSDMMSATLQANWQDTNQPEVLLTLLKEYLNGGVMMSKESFEERDGQWDTWNDPCNTNIVFWEGGGTDPRHKDMSLIGMLHEISKAELYNKFARKEYGLNVQRLNEIFEIGEEEEVFGLQQNDVHDLQNVSFYSPSNKNYYRVIECWTMETKTRYQCVDPIAKTADEARYRVEVEDIARVREENQKRVVKSLNERYGGWFVFPFCIVENLYDVERIEKNTLEDKDIKNERKIGEGNIRVFVNDSEKLEILNLSCFYKNTKNFVSFLYENGFIKSLRVNFYKKLDKKEDVILYLTSQLEKLYLLGKTKNKIEVQWADEEELSGFSCDNEKFYSIDNKI